MNRFKKSLVAGTAGVAALALVGSGALAHGSGGYRQGMAPGSGGMMGPGQGPGQGWMNPGQGMMGPGQGMMGPGQGMMDPGQGMMGPGQGMMGPGQGMMGPGQGMMGPGQGMMGPGQGMMGPGQGMMGPGQGGMQVTPSRDLTAEDVRHFLEHRLEFHGNDRLKVGEVEEVDDDTITAEVVTADDSLVERFEVDRHSGRMTPERTDAGDGPAQQPAN